MQLARRSRHTSILPYVAPAVASMAARAATNAVYNSLPSMEAVGKHAKAFYTGFRDGSAAAHKANKMESLSASRGITTSSAPVTTSHRIVTRRPTITSRKGRGAGTVVTHRELITGSVMGSTSFAIQNSIPLNPGLASAFPLLSGIAKNYEEFRWNYVRFLWIPIAPTSAQGDVIMIQEYDANAPQPSTEVDAVNHAGTTEGNIWKELRMSFSASSMHGFGNRRFVRTCSVAGDPKTYDSGIFYLGINNTVDSTTKIGKLFVEYSVELFIPRNPSIQGSLPTSVAIWQNSNSQSIVTATPTPLVYNTSLTSNSLGITLGADTKTFTLPVGFYRIELFVDCKDTSAETFTGGLDLLNPSSAVTTASGANFNVTNVANGIQSLVCVAYLQVTSSNNTVVGNVQLTGAAGTLTIPAATSLIAFSVI